MPSRRNATTVRHIAPDPTGGKRALVLCGGGITGLTYEIGALRALDDLLVAAASMISTSTSAPVPAR